MSLSSESPLFLSLRDQATDLTSGLCHIAAHIPMTQDLSAADQVVAIIGATGVQGSSVLRSLLSTPHPLRALTHSVSKLQPSEQLTVVGTDISDSMSLESGLRGAWAVFVNTFSDYSKPEGTEEALLKKIIDASSKSGVRYIVLSTLPEGMPARAYLEKSNAMQYARETAKRSGLKAIFVQVSSLFWPLIYSFI